jgi:hypothetical protein
MMEYFNKRILISGLTKPRNLSRSRKLNKRNMDQFIWILTISLPMKLKEKKTKA